MTFEGRFVGWECENNCQDWWISDISSFFVLIFLMKKGHWSYVVAFLKDRRAIKNITIRLLHSVFYQLTFKRYKEYYQLLWSINTVLIEIKRPLCLYISVHTYGLIFSNASVVTLIWCHPLSYFIKYGW